MNYVGMDIHKQFTYAVVKDKEGNELASERFDNSKENFAEFLQPYKPEETKIVMESTSVWEYIFDLLEDMKYKVIMANPVKTKAIAEARIKTDKIDAGILCDLLRVDFIAKSYVPPKEIRNLRNIMRQRKAIVKSQTQIKNKIHSVLLMNGIKLPYSTLGKSAMAWIIDEIKTTSIKTILISYINILGQHQFELKKIEERVTDIASKNMQAQLLITIPGISSIRSMEIITEIGEIERFDSSKKLCSYAGLVPSIKQSGSTMKIGRLVKQSSKNLKHAFVGASWNLVRTKEPNKFQIFYKKLMKKKGKQKAICAVARKLCCASYAMLKKNQEFMLL